MKVLDLGKLDVYCISYLVRVIFERFVKLFYVMKGLISLNK